MVCFIIFQKWPKDQGNYCQDQNLYPYSFAKSNRAAVYQKGAQVHESGLISRNCCNKLLGKWQMVATINNKIGAITERQTGGVDEIAFGHEQQVALVGGD